VITLLYLYQLKKLKVRKYLALALTTIFTLGFAQKGIQELTINTKISTIIGTNYRMYGGNSDQSIQGNFIRVGDRFQLCNVRAGTKINRYEPIDCLELKEYKEYEKEYDALYEGFISESNRYGNLRKRFTVLVRISKVDKDRFAYNFCIYDDNGYPDLYQEVLNIVKKNK